MILTCPECATRYQTDEAKFPPAGRQVRCAKCGNVWHQSAPVTVAEPELAAETPAEEAPIFDGMRAPETSARRTYAPASPRPSLGPVLAIAAGWIGLVAIVLAIGYSAVRYRQEISVIWPQSADVYSSLGMNVNTHGIDFRGVDYHRESEDGQIVLAVTGSIINAGTRELPVPQNVRVTLSDAANHEIYHWTFTPNVTTLKPGQTAPFLTRLSSPPAAARRLEVRFATPGT